MQESISAEFLPPITIIIINTILSSICQMEFPSPSKTLEKRKKGHKINILPVIINILC
jgi:hypothetical protein